MKSVIYETKGRAREFNELAVNLFTGCGHQCVYCYGADVTHQTQDSFKNQPQPRVTPDDIRRSAEEWSKRGETRRILLCFVTDPYQPIEQGTQLTRHTIQILHSYGLNVVILTKGGKRSIRDFDLLTPQDAYATTLTLLHTAESLKWEPGAAPPEERVEALEEAHRRGIETWVSLEPVIYPEVSFSLMLLTRGFVGHYKVGKMNYHPHGETVDWYSFGWRMRRDMENLGIHYYFKRDLLREMGIRPEEFEQTWVCR